MKTSIEYSTRCEATIYENNGDSWTYNYEFKKVQDALDWAQYHLESRPISFEIDRIYISDSETGEILAICTPDDDESECDFDNPNYDTDWGYNEDMGFDPYMGCYSDDC